VAATRGRRLLDQIDQVGLGVGRDQDDGRPCRVSLRQLARQVESALEAEDDVDEHHLGPQLPRPAHRVGRVQRHAHHRHSLTLEEHAGSVQEGRVVVDDEAAERDGFRLAPRLNPSNVRNRLLSGTSARGKSKPIKGVVQRACRRGPDAAPLASHPAHAPPDAREPVLLRRARPALGHGAAGTRGSADDARRTFSAFDEDLRTELTSKSVRRLSAGVS
jgi:hypothetical protein